MIVPVILSSDETMLTQFRGDKKGWPVYLTIGNIPSSIRRQASSHALKLVAYLPNAKLVFLSKEERRAYRQRLFHSCMREIMMPLIEAGHAGVRMRCADGNVRLAYPILAAYIADFPEQCLVACNILTRCPMCLIGSHNRQDNIAPGDIIKRTTTRSLRAMRENFYKPKSSYICDDDGIRSVYPPFWAGMRYTNIFECFTPDLLHQIHKGIFKEHLFEWCKTLAGAKSIDGRLKLLPDHPALLRKYPNGISHISQWTGTEAKAIQQVFVGVVVGLVPPKVVIAARALLDFIYLSSYYCHTDDTLTRLQAALNEFHANKQIFIQLKLRDDFNFPKFHMLQHYVDMIRRFGSTEGYNTENSERAHINLIKDLYRETNKKDYYKQMTNSLTREEKINVFDSYLQWLAKTDSKLAQVILPPQETSVDQDADSEHAAIEAVKRSRSRKKSANEYTKSAWYYLPKHPSFTLINQQTLAQWHGANDFLTCLTKFLFDMDPLLEFWPRIEDCFDVYKHITIWLKALNGFEGERRDIVRASPNEGGRVSFRFDTVLVHEDE